MKIEYIKTFQQVAHSGSFTVAARRLFITQPTVTQHIQLLERELGAKLLVRSKATSSLTPEGRRLLSAADKIMQLLNDVTSSIRNHDDRISGELRIGASTVMGTYVLPRILARFFKSFPDVTITVQYGNAYTIANWVRDGLVDFGFAPSVTGFPTLRIIPFHHEQCQFVVGPGHALASLTSFRIEQLKSVPFVVREKGTAIYSVTEDWLRRQDWGGASPKLITFMDMDAIKKFLAEDVGISLLPACTIRHELSCGALHGLDYDDDTDLSVSYAFILRQQVVLSALRRAFLTFISNFSPYSAQLAEIIPLMQDHPSETPTKD